jgi:hypothetical protein
MPLTEGQVAVLGVLASARSPDSYVAGSTPLNRDASRYSVDIDIFHDEAERVAAAATTDQALLAEAGLATRWIRRLPSVQTLEVVVEGEHVRLDWVADSDFRFFPASPDPTFGYVLHPVDLALNKVLAAAGRREARDLLDLLTVHERILPLGALVWAAVEKAPGFSPESLIAEVRRNLNLPAAEWRAIDSLEPVDPVLVTSKLRAALDDAEAFVGAMPTAAAGLLFIEADGRVVQPELARLESYAKHPGMRRGHWPQNPAIAAAMLEAALGSQNENAPPRI